MSQHARFFRFSLLPSLCLLLITGFLLGACGTTDPPSTRNTMTALAGNSRWKGVEVSAKRANGRVTIQGTSAIDITLKLTLYGDTAGTYRLGEILNEGIFTDGPSQWVAYGVNSGSVTVTAIDSIHVAGYFGFRAKDTTGTEQPIEIANGTFDVDFAE